MQEKISFKNSNNQEILMSAIINYPNNFDKTKKYPAIVVAHPGGGVKEQTSGLYAKKVSESGFITVAYDASYQGESGGVPRQLENPFIRVDDISAVIDYLLTLNFVDKEKIGAIGVCAGGGYTIEAAKKDRRIKALATVSGADFGEVLRRGWMGDQPTSLVNDLLLNASNQRSAEALGADVFMIPLASDKNTNELEEHNEGYEYYRTKRAMHPNSPSMMPFTSVANLINFNTYSNLDFLLTQPILLIAGSKAKTKWLSDKWFSQITSPKKLVAIENASHFDMYDGEEYVDKAVSELKTFFKENL